MTTDMERKPLFYRNPMNPTVTSPVPAKDSMGMDYIPVFPDEGKAAAEPEPAPEPEPVAEEPAEEPAAPAGDIPTDTPGILAYCRKVDG